MPKYNPQDYNGKSFFSYSMDCIDAEDYDEAHEVHIESLKSVGITVDRPIKPPTYWPIDKLDIWAELERKRLDELVETGRWLDRFDLAWRLAAEKAGLPLDSSQKYKLVLDK